VLTQGVAALVLASLAAIIDVRTSRIPNLLTFGGAAAAMVFHAFATGTSGLVEAGLGWFVGALLFFPWFALGGMGAGDVKLVAALGAWLGPVGALWLALYTAVAGGALAIVVALGHGVFRRTLENVRLLLTHWRVAGLSSLPELTLATAGGPRLAYAVPVLVGTVASLWLR